MAVAAQEPGAWRAAYLFAYCVFEGDNPYPTGMHSPEPSSGVMKFNVEGKFLGWKNFADKLHSKSSSTRKQVESYYISRTTAGGLYIDKLYIRLRLEFAEEIIRRTVNSPLMEQIDLYNLPLNSILEDICPPLVDKLGWDKDWMHPHVLYLEPSDTLLDISSVGSAEDIIEYVQALRAYFGMENHYELPSLLQDVTLLPGIGYGNHHKSCVAVRHQPLISSQEVTIPLIPDQILDEYSSNSIKRRLGAKMRDAPISGESYWSMFKADQTFEEYTRSFLALRSQADSMISRTREFLASEDDIFPREFVKSGPYISLNEQLTVSQATSWLRKSIEDMISADRKAADKYVRDYMTLMSDRVLTLNSYLKDSAMAEISRTSLLVARRVRLLTWIILMVSTIGIIASLVPSETRTDLASRISSNF